MIANITDEAVEKFFAGVESGKAGFELATAEDVFHELISRFRRRQSGQDIELLPRCWPTLCEHFGGLRSEDLMILTGESGRGKTTFVMHYALSLLSQGAPGFFACLEGGFSAFSKRLGEMILQRAERSWTMGDIGAFKEITAKLAPLYVYRPAGVVHHDRLINAMRYAVLKYQAKVCVVDHLGFVQLDLSRGVSEASAIGNFLKSVKAFNDAYKCPVMMVAHPAKSGDKGYSEREIGMDELKGSSDIKQLADTVVSIFPAGEETCLRYQKIRCSDYARNRGLGVRFRYDHATSLLTETCNRPQKFSKENGHD